MWSSGPEDVASIPGAASSLLPLDLTTRTQRVDINHGFSIDGFNKEAPRAIQGPLGDYYRL